MFAANAYWLVPVLVGMALSGIATAISIFKDPDHNPDTPPPGWVQALMFVQLWLSAYAPKGYEGIGGTRASLPLLHVPKRSQGLELPNQKSGVGVLLPICFVLFSSSCIFGQAWKKCELGALPQNAQVVEACVMGAITSIADWRAEVLACGTGLLPGQISCLVQALTTWADNGFKSGKFKGSGVHALISQRGHEFLKDNPATSCRGSGFAESNQDFGPAVRYATGGAQAAGAWQPPDRGAAHAAMAHDMAELDAILARRGQ